MTNFPEVQGAGAGFYAAVTTERAKTLRHSVPFLQKRDMAFMGFCAVNKTNPYGIFM